MPNVTPVRALVPGVVVSAASIRYGCESCCWWCWCNWCRKNAIQIPFQVPQRPDPCETVLSGPFLHDDRPTTLPSECRGEAQNAEAPPCNHSQLPKPHGKGMHDSNARKSQGAKTPVHACCNLFEQNGYERDPSVDLCYENMSVILAQDWVRGIWVGTGSPWGSPEVGSVTSTTYLLYRSH
jgi:hypothetical protein